MNYGIPQQNVNEAMIGLEIKDILDLVDLHLIAECLGVPLDTVNKWRYRDLLPPPDYPELRNPVWDWETIKQWAKETGRL